MSTQHPTDDPEISSRPAADSPESTDNYPQKCWVVHDAAIANYKGGRYLDAHRRALMLTNNAYTPYMVAISMYDVLARLTGKYSLAKEYLDKSLQKLEDAGEIHNDFGYEGMKAKLVEKLRGRAEIKAEEDQKAKEKTQEREDVGESGLPSNRSTELPMREEMP